MIIIAATFSCIWKQKQKGKVQQHSSYSRQSPFQQAPDVQVKQKIKARCKKLKWELG